MIGTFGGVNGRGGVRDNNKSIYWNKLIQYREEDSVKEIIAHFSFLFALRRLLLVKSGNIPVESFNICPSCLASLPSTLSRLPALPLAVSWGKVAQFSCSVCLVECASLTNLLQLSFVSLCPSVGCSRYQVYDFLLHGKLGSKNSTLTLSIAAVERVPEIKPEAVEEVFFGNVLSAG